MAKVSQLGFQLRHVPTSNILMDRGGVTSEKEMTRQCILATESCKSAVTICFFGKREDGTRFMKNLKTYDWDAAHNRAVQIATQPDTDYPHEFA